AVEELIKAVDRDQVSETVANIQSFTERLDEASAGLGEIMEGVNTSVASISQFANSANETLAKLDSVVGEIDPAAIGTALTNFEQASTTVNTAVNDVSKVTERIGERADDIDGIITDAQQLAARLNQASERVDGVLAKVD